MGSVNLFLFLPGGGETGALVRSLDWSRHSMGPVEGWPATLKTALAIIYGTRHPMCLWWGRNLYQFYNDAFVRCLSADKHPHALGQRCEDCWPEAWHMIGPMILQALDHGRASWSEDQNVPVTRDGRLEDAYWTYGYSPIHGPEGAIEGVLNVVTETTEKVVAIRELRGTSEELRSAILSRDAFLGIASHELNTPLTGLLLRAGLLAKQLARSQAATVPLEHVQAFASDVQLHAKRLDRLVRDMLDVSRLSSGKFPIIQEDVDLSALTHDILDSFTPQCEAANCPLDRAIEPGLRARVDATRIEQVVGNLLTNAMKYAPKSRVHVTLHGDADRSVLAVRDAGPGIAPEDQERIFARFERAHSASEVSGLGLGLYISKQIMEAHGGNISVHSVLGHGATFIVALPHV